MGESKVGPFKKNKIIGFTLIEVLVALAILSIALTAIIKSTAQNIRHTSYLQDKNIASWLGTETLNEVLAGAIPLESGATEKEQKALSRTWLIKTSSKATPNPHIQEIHVDVFRKPDDVKLISLMSYRYVAKT